MLEPKIFNKLINNIKFDGGNGIENFGFSSKVNNSEISFYVNGSSEVLVDDFGTMEQGVWNQQEPTETQILVMQSIIDNKIEELQNTPDDQGNDFDYDYYDYNGVKPEMFI